MAPLGAAPRLAVAAAAACLALLAAQLWLIGRVELTFDEAYYTLWSRSLAWGYLDHPPMIAAWIRASTLLFGPSEFGVRALGTLVCAAQPALIGWIAWRLFRSSELAALAALLWVSTPLIAAAPIVTPDAPLAIFWTLALAGLVEVWRGRATGWIAVALGLGLALLSKFTAAFLGAGIALALLGTPSLRPWLLRPAPWAAALGAAALLSPFLAWNAGHHWATFAKQFARVPPHGFAPRYLLEFAGSQAGLMNPLTAAAAAIGIGAIRWRPATPEQEARWLLVATIAPAAGYFLLHSLHDRVQGNWPAPLYPALMILAASAIVDARTSAVGVRAAIARAAGRWAPPLGLAVIALLYLHVATGLPPLGAADPTARIGGWRELAREVDAQARAEDAAFVLAHGYAATSLLTYYGGGAIPVVQRDERRRWSFAAAPSEALFASPGLAVGEAGSGYGAELAAHFRGVEEVARLPRRHDGAEVETFVVYRVRDAKGPVLADQ
jgi:4-amino-4-deoxy-L-arabinose transferase-like glycosyltransferase